MTWDILLIILRPLVCNQEIVTYVNNLLTYLVLYPSLSSFYLNSPPDKWFIKIAQSSAIRYVILGCTACYSPLLKEIKLLFFFQLKKDGEMGLTSL